MADNADDQEDRPKLPGSIAGKLTGLIVACSKFASAKESSNKYDHTYAQTQEDPMPYTAKEAPSYFLKRYVRAHTTTITVSSYAWNIISNQHSMIFNIVG